jgi:hypothetical protein
MVLSLLTLPVELVYRILDNLHNETIFLSLSNVCTRLNTIINTYQPYQVNYSFILQVSLSSSSKHCSLKKNAIFSSPLLYPIRSCVGIHTHSEVFVVIHYELIEYVTSVLPKQNEK